MVEREAECGVQGAYVCVREFRITLGKGSDAGRTLNMQVRGTPVSRRCLLACFTILGLIMGLSNLSCVHTLS